MENTITRIPMVPLRGLVVYPAMVTNFEAARDFSIAALEGAMKADRRVFLVTQKNANIDKPIDGDLYPIGIVAKVRYILRLPAGGIRVMIEGTHRARLVNFVFENGIYQAETEPFGSEIEEIDIRDAYRRRLLAAAEELSAVSGRFNPDTLFSMRELNTLTKLVDTIALNVLETTEEKQDILETEALSIRADKLLRILDREKQIALIENDINKRTRQQLERYQKEGYLREQMRAIQTELGEGQDGTEIEEFREQLEKLDIREEDKAKVRKELDRLALLSPSSPDYNVSRNYIEWILSMPFGVYTEDKLDLAEAEAVLDREHYGMEKVKERILEFLAVRSMTKGNQGSIICFAGPPGVGKTSISRSIAEALGRKFVRMSLGGVRDEAEIRGHRRTYIGAIPGRIVSGIKEAGTMNPVFLLDEIDKMSNDFRGDPASAMLEVLDPTTNTGFKDHYLDIDFDLSDVIFLTTANDIDMIPRPLFDRMEIINLSSYTAYEKFEIGKRHLIPKQLEKHGLKKSILRIEDSALEKIISGYTYESGVRDLERQIGTICRKAARQYLGGKKRMAVRVSNLEKYLGQERFKDTSLPKEDGVGVVVGLAWTSGGGTTMPIETAIMEGGGGIELTGQLGDVMKESAKTALSYIRSKADFFGLEKGFLKEDDMHIHVPEGAVPKDGPSAGITMCTAMLSSLTGRKVRHDVAMTGEITLTGRVLPIGGLKEKSLAALRAGITTVIIPEANRRDAEEMPEEIKKQIRFIPVSEYAQVAEVVFAE
ncbi:MAG: endopeptidase La [Clostridiales bacterium]|nr:endopeptidase La [Clostridiales bacterium]